MWLQVVKWLTFEIDTVRSTAKPGMMLDLSQTETLAIDSNTTSIPQLDPHHKSVCIADSSYKHGTDIMYHQS